MLDDDRSPAAAAATYGCTWNTCHDAAAATADPLYDIEPEPVTVLVIDETSSGKAKYEMCQKTGKRARVDQFDMHWST